MAYFIDLTGQTFGALAVLERINTNKKGRFWLVRCACGNVEDRTSIALRNQGAKYCRECVLKQKAARRTTHGESNPRSNKKHQSTEHIAT